MMAPFYKFGMFGEEFSLVMAFIIGIGFGFFLERAGFGSARKLTAQFYMKDLSVFKVMFTAIVTAMLGVFFLGAIGYLDISLVYISNTYILPQVVGGLVLGAGFVVGGYCPGTSVVACSTGKIDGFIFLLGVFLGVFIFGEIYPIIEGFAKSTDMGKATLYSYFNISYGLIVLFVVIIALLGFMGAEWWESSHGSIYKGTEL